MKIKPVTPVILHVPATGRQIADSTRRICGWGVVGARIEPDGRQSGYGFTATHAHLPGDQLIARWVETGLAPPLVGDGAGTTTSALAMATNRMPSA